MAITTWNTSDSQFFSFSGGNLIATTLGGGSAGVRSVLNIGSGKSYWEYTFTTTGSSAQDAVGVCTLAHPISISGGTGTTGSSLFFRTGNVFLNGTSNITGFGTLSSGALICIAVDLDLGSLWFRSGAGGNWNNSGTANPATNAGGIGIGGTFPSGTPAYGVAFSNFTAHVLTANFANSGFTGAVPAGFTSGFATGGAAAAQARAMVLA